MGDVEPLAILGTEETMERVLLCLLSDVGAKAEMPLRHDAVVNKAATLAENFIFYYSVV